MVKGATARSNKYANKVDSSVVKSRIDAQKTDMQNNASAQQSLIAGIQAQVRGILDQTPAISTTLSQPFMACALELWKKSVKFTSQNLQNEGTIVLTKWNTRLTGVTNAHAKLVSIAGLFGITYA